MTNFDEMSLLNGNENPNERRDSNDNSTGVSNEISTEASDKTSNAIRNAIVRGASNGSKTIASQLIFILIVVSAGLMLGRIASVDNIPDRAVQDYRLRLIPKQLAEKKAELEKQNVAPERIASVLKKTAVSLVRDAKKERPTLSANDRSRWLTIRALVEPEARVYRYIPQNPGAKPDGDAAPKWKTSEILRNCSCPCSQQFNKENRARLDEKKFVKRFVPYAIDKAMEDPGWDSIDVVKHGLPDEEFDPADPLSGYLYSSKPTLLPTLMAVPYWILFHATGLSLKENPFVVVPLLLVLFNWIPLVFAWILLGKMIDRIGVSDWAKIFATSVVCFATFVSTFVVTLNNHIPGVVCVIFATYGAFQILCENRPKKRYFALTGFFGALAVACELPILAVALIFCLLLFWKKPLKTVAVAIPFGLVVVAGFFGTNYQAHGTWKPAYAQKRNHVALAQEQANRKQNSSPLVSDKTNASPETPDSPTPNAASAQTSPTSPTPNAVSDSAATTSAANASEFLVQTFDPDDWYVYRYIPSGKVRDVKNARLSHWANRTGIDRGEPSQKAYAFHATIGHHGLFSLTPVWFLSFLGIFVAIVSPKTSRAFRGFALLVLGLSSLFFVFYLTRDQGDRNYGGTTCGLRWFFPLIPFWVLAMLPLLDTISKKGWARGSALILLLFSAASVAYPVWNPWSHPWFYQLMIDWNWIVPF